MTEWDDRARGADLSRDTAGFGPLAPEEPAERGGWLLVVSAVGLIVFIGLLAWAYHQGVRAGGRDAPPRIAAQAEPFKVRPDDPGGAPPPPNNPVYELVERRTASVEPEPSDTPESRGVRLMRLSEEDGEAAQAQASTRAEAASTPVPRSPDDVEARRRQTARPADAAAGPDGLLTLDARGASAAAATPDTAPFAGPAPQPRIKPAVAELAVAELPYAVQVASFRSEAAATTAWTDMAVRFPQLMEGRTPEVAAADLGERGVYHRLRVAGFAERDLATAFCEALRAEGEACLVVRR